VAYATEGEKLMQNAEDLRVRRTRKLLQKAMLEAAREKGFARITVRDITERAMVNRATFYRHYQDKYDLLTHYMQELSGLIDTEEERAASQGRPTSLPVDMAPSGLAKLLRHMQANADFYRVMLGRNGDPSFCAQTFRGYIEQGYRRMLPGQAAQADSGRPPIDLMVSYLLNAGIGAIVWWLENDQPTSPERMADWLYQLSMAGIGASLVGAGGHGVHIRGWRE
jgi:AcrR family transcriptional regulator